MQFSLKEDMEKINQLPRDKFEEFYFFLNSLIWEMPGITIDEIKRIRKETDEQDDSTRSFFSNEKLRNLLKIKQNVKYTDEESLDFIKEVKASNVTDIADSGYFYKKICNCLDDVFIEKEDCNSDGELFKTITIDEEAFKFYIRDSFVVETEKYYDKFEDFISDMNEGNIREIHVRNPLSCKMAPKRCFCKKCCGKINTGGRQLTSPNIGFITSLAITESATQASLSSMNEGTKENVNVILERKLENFSDWNELLDVIKKRVESIGYSDVQARWYYISLLSRFVLDEKAGIWKATSFTSNSNYGDDLLGAYIFQHTENNLKKMINKKEFRLNSLKSKNLFGIYN